MSRKLKIFFTIFLIGLAALYFYKKYRVAPSFPLAQQEVTDISGNKINLGSVINKPTIISFYASWCGDCIREMNDLQAISDKELNGINIICITDESMEKLLAFNEKRKYSFRFYRINKSFNELGINTIPVTYLLNSKGTVVYNKVGLVKWKDDSFLQFAKTQLTNY